MIALATTLIITFATPAGLVVEQHRYANAADCQTVARLFDGETNPLGERMTARCVAETR